MTNDLKYLTQKRLKQTSMPKYYVLIWLYQSFQTQLFCTKNRPMVEIPKEKSGTVNFAGIACMSMSANRFESTKSSLTQKKFFSILARITCFSYILEYLITVNSRLLSQAICSQNIYFNDGLNHSLFFQFCSCSISIQLNENLIEIQYFKTHAEPCIFFYTSL